MIITILRKPLEGTVAENTLKHGCGALDIDSTRISTSDNLNGGAYAENPTERGGEDMWTSSREADSNCFRRGGAGDYEQPSGRWPANFILTHKEGCEIKGNKKIKEGKKYTENGGGVREKGLYEDGLKKRANDPDQGEETISDWDCEEGCPVKNLDDQSGVLKSGAMMGSYKMWGRNGIYSGANEYSATTYGDSGGASRFFKQFKKENDR